MHIGNYLALVHNSEEDLAKAYHMVSKHHGKEPDVYEQCQLQALWSENIVEELKPFVERYSEEKSKEPDRLMNALFHKPRSGSLGLLRDLHDLWLMARETELCSVILRQASVGLHDTELTELCNQIEMTAKRQLAWLLTRMKSAAPQTLIAAE
jgi:hypothetical protein